MARLLQNFKKIAVLAIAAIALSLNINAQEWYIYGVYTLSAPHPIGTFYERHYHGETIEINGIEYQTIYVYNFRYETTSLAGAYRNEDNQVYYRKWNGTAYGDEVLLYDYDLEEGDFFHDDDDHPMQVMEVSTITDNNGIARKKISFEFIGLPDETEYWIQGIGSDRGFMYVGRYEPEYESDGEMYHMLCYHIGENLIYINPEYNQCDIDDVEENVADDNVSIYPNPAKDIVKILNNNDLTISNIEIIDLTGRIVLSTDKAADIDISELSEGQYFVKVYGETTIVKKLFIVK